MGKAFFTRCAIFLLASGCTGAAEEQSSRTGGTIRVVLKLSDGERPRLGKPINLTLGVVNDGAKEVSINFAEADINNSLVVAGPDGKPVPYISGHTYSNCPTLELDAGEEMHFTLDLDLAEQYLVDKPGRYTVRYEGKGLVIDGKRPKVLPCTVEIDVAEGKLDRRMEIAARLFPLVPKGLTFGICPRWGDVDTDNIEVEAGHYVYRETETLPEVVSYVMVIGFEFRIANGRPRPSEELLGKTRWGFLFANVETRNEEFWPNWRKLVAEALEVRSP